METFIGYCRVSTDKQGVRGLGMEAQQQAIDSYIGEGQLLQTYIEVESGRKAKRPELLKAIDHAKRTGSTLVIAKLDRLSRNMAFIANLMESKVKFRCCDIPEADPFTIHIFAAMAQREAELISRRTTEALRIAKQRGVKLGNPQADRAHMDRMRAARKPLEISPQIQFVVNQLKDKPLPIIAAELNKQGFRTTRNHPFGPVQVYRIKQRLSLS
jgi:DNA invertase Pin-like site-specific DNA recombinase